MLGRRSSLPGAEARGTLGTVPSGLRATFYLHITRSLPKCLWFFYHIITSQSSDPTLLSLYLRLRLFHPCLLPPLCGWLPRPYPHDIQVMLLPPSPGYANSWLPIWLQSKVHDRTGSNVLHDCVLAEGNIDPDIIQSHHFQRHPNRWVHPFPVLLTFGAHACHLPRRMVAKTLKVFL